MGSVQRGGNRIDPCYPMRNLPDVILDRKLSSWNLADIQNCYWAFREWMKSLGRQGPFLLRMIDAFLRDLFETRLVLIQWSYFQQPRSVYYLSSLASRSRFRCLYDLASWEMVLVTTITALTDQLPVDLETGGEHVLQVQPLNSFCGQAAVDLGKWTAQV